MRVAAVRIRQKYGDCRTGSRIFSQKTNKNTAVDTAIAILLAVLELKIWPGGAIATRVITKVPSFVPSID